MPTLERCTASGGSFARSASGRGDGVFKARCAHVHFCTQGGKIPPPRLSLPPLQLEKRHDGDKRKSEYNGRKNDHTRNVPRAAQSARPLSSRRISGPPNQ